MYSNLLDIMLAEKLVIDGLNMQKLGILGQTIKVRLYLKLQNISVKNLRLKWF